MSTLSYSILIPSLLFAGCSPEPPKVSDDPYAVAFSVEPIGTPGEDTLRLMAVWEGEGERTQFDLVLTTPDPQEGQPFAFGKGWMIARPPSQAHQFLARLAAAHGVDGRYGKLAATDTLPMTVGILGRNLSRGHSVQPTIAGVYSSDPPGPWLSTKLFLDESSESGALELFLNINLEERKAEFSVKDPAYGPSLLTVLATVLESDQ
ncbi:MAG TPA: hypothetical protein PKJ19_08520 [Flavobacteriales bacterium]|nr:hypothetical protein [Flavobacteriales bacterium]